MKELKFCAVAIAAGLMAFAVAAQASASESPRAEGNSIAKAIQPAKGVKSGEAKTVTAAPSAGKKSKKAKPQLISKNIKATTAKSKRSGRKAISLDRTETASIGAKPAIATYPAGNRYGAIVQRYAASYGVPVALAHAVIRVESNYRPDTLGRAGEIGLMQIKPMTARMMGYTGSIKGLYDPDTNIKYGMKYLAMAQELGGGTTCGTILKYNAGHAARRMNPVSSAYCSKVKVHMAGA
jgi:soluble lytic murein transglycosylase-like protein